MAKRNPLENVKPVSGFSPNLEDLKRQLGMLEGTEEDEASSSGAVEEKVKSEEPAPPAAKKRKPRGSGSQRKTPARKRKVARKAKVVAPELDLETSDQSLDSDTSDAPVTDDKAEILYSIGEVAQKTDLETHVLRYWESQFEQLKPVKSSSGKRMYRESDIELVTYIRHLLKDAKYTIDGARQVLEKQPKPGKFDRAVWTDLRHFLIDLRDRLPNS